MALPKVMGIETEYGITVRNQADFNPILSSLLLINSYETYRTARIRWDYEAESPLRDARGFEYAEEKELPSKEESRLINLILPNGARFYVDHAHPEYSTPECTNPRDLVIWDRAGERIVPKWMDRVYDRLPAGENLHYFMRHRQAWHHVEKITTCDMPAAMRGAKLLPLWLPEGHLLDGERNAIHRLAAGRKH